MNRNTAFQNLAFVVCVLFGMAMILNVQPAGDGVWFWYATFLRQGKRLYADMHLALQPLFVLETAWCMDLLGKGWLVSKLPAVLHVVAYCLALLLILRRSQLPDWQKAIVMGCAFFVSISFEAYRFDDYHVLADCFQLYSLIALLKLQETPTVRTELMLCGTLGVLSGLTMTTRLNDGAALALSVMTAILCLVPAKRLLSCLLFGTAALLTVVTVISLTGDSLRDYALYSILHAAGSKGGTGHVLLYPLHLPVNTWRWLKQSLYQEIIAYALAIALFCVFLVRPLLRKRGLREILPAVLGLAILGALMPRFSYLYKEIDVVMGFSAVAVLVAYGLGALVIFRSLRWLLGSESRGAWNRREILLLVPLGQLASGSMSTGGVHMGLYGPIAVLIVLLAVCSPISFKVDWPRDLLITIAALLMCSAASYRIWRPYSWHSYREPPLFTGRTWYRHPQYGPMVLDRDLLTFIEPVCRNLEADKGDLLSLPFPFANYFCATPPWHGYVQTFFDTSSKETIDGLMSELASAPPKWIFYQRQPFNLKLHEKVFNHGEPLEHRYLDEMIERKINDGEWTVVYTSNFQNWPPWDNTWMLIRTGRT